jgi:hypothetical protein
MHGATHIKIILIEFCVVITTDKMSGFASYQVPTDTEECP